MKILFLQLALYFFTAVTLIIALAASVGLKLHDISNVILIILLWYLVSMYILKQNRPLSQKEYWQIFFTAIGIYLVYDAIMVSLLGFAFKMTYRLSLNIVMLDVIKSALSAFIGLWIAKRFAKRTTALNEEIMTH